MLWGCPRTSTAYTCVAPSICSKNDGALFEFQSREVGFWCPFNCVRMPLLRFGRVVYVPQTGPRAKNGSLSVIQHIISSRRFIPRHSPSFVTTSAQNFVKGPLRVAFKSTNNRVQRRPRHHELCAVATGLQPVVMHEECSRRREAPAVLPHSRAHLPRSGTHAPKHTTTSATPAGTRWPSRSLH